MIWLCRESPHIYMGRSFLHAMLPSIYYGYQSGHWAHRYAVNRCERRKQQGVWGEHSAIWVTPIVTGKRLAEGIVGDSIAEGLNMK